MLITAHKHFFSLKIISHLLEFGRDPLRSREIKKKIEDNNMCGDRPTELFG